MLRTTILLPPALKHDAEEKAREMGLSFGELIRRSIQLLLAPPKNHKKGRKKDSLFSDMAVYDGPTPENLAKDHDEFLYGRGR